jgi:hypothetical protein
VSNSLVKQHIPEKIAALVKDFLYDEFDKLGSRNTIKVNYGLGALPWVGEKDHWNFKAAYAATQVRVVITRFRVLCTGRTTWILTVNSPDRPWVGPRPLLYARGRHYSPSAAL